MTEVKKIAFILPVLLLFGQPQFQHYFLHKYPLHRRTLGLYTYADLGSNSINTKFFNHFFTGQYISDALKNSVRNRLNNNNNRFGFDWTTEISYLNMHDSVLGKNWGYYFGLKNRVTGEGGFTQNAFELPFYGNSMFQGKTANLSGTQARFLMYQQFQIGFVKTWKKSDPIILGFALSYLNGNNFSELNFRKLDVYTDSLSEYISIDGSGFLYRNDPNYNYFMANNGSGLSVDVNFQQQFNHGFFSCQLQDLGFLSWERPGEQITYDTLYQFNGITINNIFTTDGSEFSNFIDSLNTNVLRQSSSRPGTMMLPSRFHVAYTHFLLQGKIVLQASLMARLSLFYFPMLNIQGIFYPHPRIMLGTSFGFGGYGTYQFGLNFGVDFGKGYILSVQTQNVEGIIPNTFATGLSAGIRFYRTF